MKNKRGNIAVIALIIAIVAITAGIVGWMFAKKSQAPVQQAAIIQPAPVTQTQPVGQSAPDDETTSWQTYQNEMYGFELKFPSDMRIDEVNGVVSIGYAEYQKNLSEGGRNMFISSKKISLENFIKEYEQKDPGINKIDKQEDIQVGQTSAKKLTGTTAIGINTNFALIKKSDGSYIIIEFSDSDNIHKKILATFKLESNSAANLQTYKNDEYGFSFAYPVTWKMVTLSQASSIDYLPGSRNFVAIYPDKYPAQDFSARVDVYSVSLATVKRDNPFLKNLSSSIQVINGISWTKMGDTNYLTEKNGKTYGIFGQGDLASQIVSTFKFTN